MWAANHHKCEYHNGTLDVIYTSAISLKVLELLSSLYTRDNILKLNSLRTHHPHWLEDCVWQRCVSVIPLKICTCSTMLSEFAFTTGLLSGDRLPPIHFIRNDHKRKDTSLKKLRIFKSMLDSCNTKGKCLGTVTNVEQFNRHLAWRAVSPFKETWQALVKFLR